MNDEPINWSGADWPGNSDGQGHAHNPPGHEEHPGNGWHHGHQDPPTIPEPAESALVLLGLAGILAWVTWKTKRDKL